MTAAESSILGIVTGFIGANLNFPMTNEQFTFPARSSILMYVTAPSRCCEESEKWCSWHDAISPRSGDLKQPSIVSCF